VPSSDVRAVMFIGDSVTNVGDPLAALDALAVATPHDRATPVASDSPDPTGVLARVVVTGRVDASLAATLDSLTPTSGAAVVIAGEPIDVTVPRGWLSVSCPSLDDFERRWPDFVRTTGRGS
ncbi:MAG: hypothetical protein ACK49V_03440, partial [Actinomycetes bacterium]